MQTGDRVLEQTGDRVLEQVPGARMECMSSLNPVDVGACHGLTMGEIRQMLGPQTGDRVLEQVLETMRSDPSSARLPGGESQQDVTKRLEPFIVDYLERQLPNKQ
ncbi:hypothetical protein T484DRAFT_1848923 [Baffinella frigidus]|nr:hypothetical protein T484DRAFT_1848923 [Cryptophyta sp. CCMP2293]